MQAKECKTHPRYLGILKPKIDCPDCWRYYNADKMGSHIAGFGGNFTVRTAPTTPRPPAPTLLGKLK